MTLPTLLPVRDLPLSVTDTQIARALGAYTLEEWERAERLRRSRYCLVTNDQKDACKDVLDKRTGRVLRRGCGRKHDYLTVGCIPLPYRGLDKALYKYVQVSRDPLGRRLVGKMLPDLADFHPYTAHAMQPQEPGADFYALAAGFARDIGPQYALELCRLIVGRGGQLPFPIQEVEQDAQVSRSGARVDSRG